jgi:diguanylate cyclase (GGDEF)-like protein/PAS domain S-box-containing protein
LPDRAEPHRSIAEKSSIPAFAIILGVVAVYLAAAALGLSFSPAVDDRIVIAVWLPGGVAFAAIWCFGRIGTLATIIGAVLHTSYFGGSIWHGIWGATTIVLPVHLSIYWLQRSGVQDLFGSPRAVGLFTLYCGTIAAGLSTLMWVIPAALGYFSSPTPLPNLALNWYGATMLGICLVAPPLVCWRDWRALTRRQWIEVAALNLLVIGMCWYLFGVKRLPWSTPLAMQAMPFILAMALRYNFGVVASMTMLQALITLLAAYSGLMPGDARSTYSFLQLFLTALALSMLGMGAGRAAITQAFQRLTRSEAQFRAMFEQAAIGLMMRDTVTGERRVNQKLCDMLGYPEDELPYPTLSAISLPDEMQLTEELTAQLVRGDIQNAHQQKRYIRKDGSTIWASLTMSMLRGDGDEPRLFFAVFEDISERKRIEAQIHGQSSVLRALTLGTPLPELLEQIALLADELWPDSRCAIFTADNDKNALFFAAGPHLPQWTPDPAQPIPIADGMASTPTAAARREMVISSDTALDPRWATHPGVSTETWQRAAWAMPCSSNDGQLLGVATLYFDHPCEPNAQDRELLETIAWLTAIVVQRHRDARDLFTSEQRLRSLFEQNAIGVVLTTADGSSMQVNQKYLDIVGYSHEELVSSQFKIFVPPEDLEQVDADIQRLVNREADHYQVERRYIRKGGQEIWCNVTTTVVCNEAGDITLFIGLAEDITERKLAEAEVERLALFDVLTGLPNRRLFGDRLQTALATARRSGQIGALIYIDLDNFKQLNDARGHSAGDELLQQIATRLRQQLREEDSVARLGGDEFVVLLQNIDSNADEASRAVSVLAQKLRSALAVPYILQSGFEHIATASIGITLFPKGDESADDLMKQADFAMYRVKAEQRNAFRFYAPEMRDAADRRIALEHDFRHALQHDGFELYLQPQYDAQQVIIGSEALLRWQRSENQFVSPMEFIPLAEQTGLIVPLGEWVLAEVAKIIHRSELQGYELSISVNVSPRQFQEADFVDRVRDILWEHGADAGRLIIEITEGSVMADFEDARTKMIALKKLGIRLSIDDFGTGHSSLAYLKRLPLHELKIDREFVNDLPHDANDVALVEAILAVTRHLQLEVVAEGVETAGQFEFLAERQCHRFQGFFLAQPQPVNDYLALLAETFPPPPENPDDSEDFLSVIE